MNTTKQRAIKYREELKDHYIKSLLRKRFDNNVIESNPKLIEIHRQYVINIRSLENNHDNEMRLLGFNVKKRRSKK
jgi:hypothetical protein